MQEKIYDDISNLLVGDYGMYPDDIRPDATLREDFDLDSLDKVEFAMKVERQFNIKVADEDMDKILTMQDVVNYVDERIQAYKPAR